MTKWLIAGALLLASATAAAQADRGFYFTGGVGQSQYDISKQDLDEIATFALVSNGAIIQSSSSSLDDEGSTWALGGGYRFFRYFAVEAAYVDLGTSKYTSNAQIFVPQLGQAISVIGLDIQSKGATVAALGTLPVNDKFDVHGRLGTFFADTTVDISVGIGTFNTSDDVSSTSQSLFAGVGAAYHFTKRFGLSLDYSVFRDVGDDEDDGVGEGDVDAIRLSVLFAL